MRVSVRFGLLLLETTTLLSETSSCWHVICLYIHIHGGVQVGSRPDGELFRGLKQVTPSIGMPNKRNLLCQEPQGKTRMTHWSHIHKLMSRGYNNGVMQSDDPRPHTGQSLKWDLLQIDVHGLLRMSNQ